VDNAVVFPAATFGLRQGLRSRKLLKSEMLQYFLKGNTFFSNPHKKFKTFRNIPANNQNHPVPVQTKVAGLNLPTIYTSSKPSGRSQPPHFWDFSFWGEMFPHPHTLVRLTDVLRFFGDLCIRIVPNRHRCQQNIRKIKSIREILFTPQNHKSDNFISSLSVLTMPFSYVFPEKKITG
jgi:hypothetical protein